MTIKSTGPLSFTDIATEYSAASAKPFKLSQFYRGAGKVPSGIMNIPASGLIKFSHFYGQSNLLPVTFTLIGGGGGGGGGGHGDDNLPRYGGGGGGGGGANTATGTFNLQFGLPYTIVVGAGGAGGAGGTFKETPGSPGTNGASTYVDGFLSAQGGDHGGVGGGGDAYSGVGSPGYGGAHGGKSGVGRNGGSGGDSSIGNGGMSGWEGFSVTGKPGTFGAGGGGGLGGLMFSAEGLAGGSGGRGGDGVVVIKYSSAYPKAMNQGASVYTLEGGMHTYTFYSAGTYTFTL